MKPFEWLVDGVENGSPVRTRALQALRFTLDWAVAATVALLVLAFGYAGATALRADPGRGVVAVLWVVLTWTLLALLPGVGRPVLHRLAGRRTRDGRGRTAERSRG